MNRSRGAVLIISLIILLALTLIGVTAIQNASQEERMTSNNRQRDLAFQAAEAALRAGEEVCSGAPTLGSSPGLYSAPLSITSDIASYWMGYGWSSTDSQSYNGTLASNLANQPRYVIELLFTTTTGGGGSLQAGQPVSAGLPTAWYRVTARGEGGTADAVAIVQSVYRN
jgi:type IV pilus assembly protein PilX